MGSTAKMEEFAPLGANSCKSWPIEIGSQK